MRNSILSDSRKTLRMLKAIPLLGLILALALVLVVVVNTAVPVSAATAGPNYAGTGSNVNGPGTVNWTDPGYITAGDTSYATAILGGAATSEYLQGTNYGFSIPLDASINGITVSIMRKDSSGNGAIDADLYMLKAGTIVGLNHADTITKWPVKCQQRQSLMAALPICGEPPGRLMR
jgi:hypothetical protein